MNKENGGKTLLCVFCYVLVLLSCGPSPKPFTLIIKGGLIVDGSGSMGFRADIGLKDDKIVKIGTLKEKHAERVIHADKLVVTPGFIDIHTHCDRDILQVPTADNYIMQGVTTVIGGNCGGHPFPLKNLFSELEEKGMSVNFGVLVGHNTIRREVMEFKMDGPTSEEMEKMKALVEEEMRAGALGFSTGLSYLPGVYSETDEIVELAYVASKMGGIYATHLRDQGEKITEAIQEAIEVGEENNMPVQISHIKLAEDSVWNDLERITKPVEEARSRGVTVTLDQYPYTATSSGFTSSFPQWCFEGGKEKFLERLKDKKTYEKIKSYIIGRRLSSEKGINKLETIFIARAKNFPEYEGKNLQEILLAQGKGADIQNGADLIIDIEKNGGASGVFFQMDEKDVEDLMRLPYVMHASDGGIEVVGKGVPHPRNYGTFPRVIGRYVREKKVIPLEEAVRKMTYFPAEVFKLDKRGLLRDGMHADITIFDWEAFTDSATYENPHQYSNGLHYVIVNGDIVIEKGVHSGKRPGRILYGDGYAPRNEERK